MNAASVRILRVAVTAETVARNLVRMAGSTRPVDVAEALGFAAYRAGPDLTFGAPGAVLGRRIYVLEGQSPDDENQVIAELAAMEAIGVLGLVPADPETFAGDVAAWLLRMGSKPRLRAVI